MKFGRNFGEADLETIKKAKEKISITPPKRCSDYDNTCKGMSPSQALHCFTGLKNHPCSPNHDCGMADGQCPIL